jgi:multiple sugar transport system permease protein
MNFKHKYVFLFPGLFVLIGILIFPIIFVVRLSLSGWNSYNGLNFIGLENYIRLFTDDPRFWQSFFRLSFLSCYNSYPSICNWICTRTYGLEGY